MASRGNNAPNFKTDVNRMKTQKWVQASKANYGGDDWGGYDDYDDYEEEPPPPPRTTGLRQRGQGTAASSPDSLSFAPEQGLRQAPMSGFSALDSHPPSGAQPHQRARAGSFESGDDSNLTQPAQFQPPQKVHGAQSPTPRSPPLGSSPTMPPAETTPSQPHSQPPYSTQPARPMQNNNQSPRGESADGGGDGRHPPSSGRPPQGMTSQQSQQQRAPVIEGPYRGPGSSQTPQQYQSPPRQDSRGPPSMGRSPQSAQMSPPPTMGGRGPPPGQMPPPGQNGGMRPPPGQVPQQGNNGSMRPSQGGAPPYGAGRPYGPGRNHSGTPPGQDPYMRRDTPPGGRGPHPSQRPRAPSSQDRGPRKRPSQEFGLQKSPSPSSEFRPRHSPSQEFRPRQSPSQEFRPPPRKESLTNNRRPSIPEMRAAPPPEQQNQSSDRTPERRPSPNAQIEQPQAEPESEPEPKRTSFVRPADIYRRVEQERERERQSMDSSRPSLDSIERTSRPTSYGAPPVPRISQDSARDAGPSSSLKPRLDPVAERKSEYGMDGFMIQDPAFAKAVGSQVSTGAPSLDAPSLPHFERFSGFNVDDFINSRKEPATPVEASAPTVRPETPDHSFPASAVPSEQPPHVELASEEPATVQKRAQAVPRPDDLQHQPSLGFRSAVNDAFDGNDDQSTLSPASIRGSQNSKGSDMSRSNTTDSTAGISPIMSRVPSAATAERRFREADANRVHTPTVIQEEAGDAGSPESRPTSSDTLKGQQQHRFLGSAGQSRQSSDDSVATKTAKRRSMQSPSPVNVPSRLTAVSARKAMEQHSHEAEYGVTTPVDASSREGSSALQNQRAPDFSTRESDLAAAAQTPTAHAARGSNFENAASNAQNSFMATHPPSNMPAASTDSSRRPETPASRSGSPAKSRVRDLATKYNDIHGARASSPTGSVASWASSTKTSPVDTGEPVIMPPTGAFATPTKQTAKPSAIRSEAQKTADMASLPRPSIPGGWVSYQPSEASDAHSVSDRYESANEHERAPVSTSRLTTPKVNREPSSESLDFYPNTAKQPLSGQTFPAPTENPLAALSAAGAALADSVKHMAGVGNGDSTDDEEDPRMRARPGIDSTTMPTPMSPDEMTTSASSAAPTPPVKDHPYAATHQRSSGYFPPAPPLNIQKHTAPVSGVVESREPTSAASATSGRLSIEPSASDTEADVLRKDIARSLSPPQSSQGAGGLASISERQSAMSSVLPQEYDAYWANQGGSTSSPKTARFSGGSVVKASPSEVPSSPDEPNASRSARSSATRDAAVAAPVIGDRTSLSSHPRPISATGPGKLSMDSSSTSDSMRLPAELDSTSFDPNRVSSLREVSPEPAELDDSSRPRRSTEKALPTGPMLGRQRADTATGKDQPKPPAFKDIMNMKGQRERVSALNAAKDLFGVQHTGLNDWLTHMVERNPEHANAMSAPMRSSVQTSGIAGSVKNKMPPSIAKFGKTNTGGTPTSAATSDTYSSAGPQIRESPSVSRKQFLQQANAFGGKASQGAKGLFAKGRSRLRGASSEKEKSTSASPHGRSRHASPSPMRRQSRPEVPQVREALPSADYRTHLSPNTQLHPPAHSNLAPDMTSIDTSQNHRLSEQPMGTRSSNSSGPSPFHGGDTEVPNVLKPLPTTPDMRHGDAVVDEPEPKARGPNVDIANDVGKEKSIPTNHTPRDDPSTNHSSSTPNAPSHRPFEVIPGPWRPSTHDRHASTPSAPGHPGSSSTAFAQDPPMLPPLGHHSRTPSAPMYHASAPAPSHNASSIPAPSQRDLTPMLGEHYSMPATKQGISTLFAQDRNVPTPRAGDDTEEIAVSKETTKPTHTHAPAAGVARPTAANTSPERQQLSSGSPAAPIRVYENCRDSAELNERPADEKRRSWQFPRPRHRSKSRGDDQDATPGSRMSWAGRARSRSNSRKESVDDQPPPPMPASSPPPPLPPHLREWSSSPSRMLPEGRSRSNSRSNSTEGLPLPAQDPAPPMPRDQHRWTAGPQPAMAADAHQISNNRKASMEGYRAPAPSAHPPMPRNQSPWRNPTAMTPDERLANGSRKTSMEGWRPPLPNEQPPMPCDQWTTMGMPDARSASGNRQTSTEGWRPPLPSQPPSMPPGQSQYPTNAREKTPDSKHQTEVSERPRSFHQDYRQAPPEAQHPAYQSNRPKSFHQAQQPGPQHLPHQLDTKEVENQPPQYQRYTSPPPMLPPIPMMPPTFNPIDSSKRHYARKNTGDSMDEPRAADTEQAHKPPVPQKSRNRLSKRFSTPIAPPASSPEPMPISETPKKQKRASMFGSILRRSDKSQEDNITKVQNSKLKKSNSRKLTKEEAAEFTIPAVPVPPLPRAPTAQPHLPNIDTADSTAGQREPSIDHPASASASASKSNPNSALNDYADYYNSNQTPTFEAAPSGVQFRNEPAFRATGRDRHINYLQSQDMFPSRQQNQAPPSAYNRHTAIDNTPVSPMEDTAAIVPGKRSSLPSRVPSGASSVYNSNIDEQLHNQPSTASTRYGAAGDFAAQRQMRPLTGAYAQFARGPYDEAVPEGRRNLSGPMSGGGGGNAWASGQGPGLAQMYADKRRPR